MKRIIGFHDISWKAPIAWGKKASYPPNLQRKIFLSWTDALKYLLKEYERPTVLIPALYCRETAALIGTHGVVRTYKKNPIEILKAQKPDIVIRYGLKGIPMDMTEKKALRECGALVIEDFSHAILLPENIQPMHDKHIYIESLRKSVSIEGANMFGTHLPPGKSRYLTLHKTTVRCLRFTEDVVGFLAWKTGSEFLYNKSDEIFDVLDRQMGSGEEPEQCGMMTKWFLDHLDREKIIEQRKKMGKIYQNIFVKLPETWMSHQTKIEEKEFQYMAYMPLEAGENAKNMLRFLKEKQIRLYTLWDTNCILLPISGVVSENDAESMGNAVLEFAKKNIWKKTK